VAARSRLVQPLQAPRLLLQPLQTPRVLQVPQGPPVPRPRHFLTETEQTDWAKRGAERAVRARAAARAASAARRFVFRAEHAPLCRDTPGDYVDEDADAAAAAAAAVAAGASPQAPLARALARAPGLARVVLGGPFATALARDELRDCDAADLLRALVGHPHLEALMLEGDLRAWGAALGPALGALVAANAPALTSLRVAGCALGDAGLGALAAALPRNTHLRALECNGSALSAAFTLSALLPAVRANGWLQEPSADDVVWGSF
jgi:hypothetical protein